MIPIPLLIGIAATCAVMHLIYWAMVRPLIHERISYQLNELRDQLVEAHLSNREGVNSQLFHEAFQSFRAYGTKVRRIGLLAAMWAGYRNPDFAAEVNRREQLLEESPSWLCKIEINRGRLLIFAAISNSPFVLMFAAPFIMLMASKTALMRVRAAIFIVNDRQDRGRGPKPSGGGMGLAHA